MNDTIEIGSLFWAFDENRRVYDKTKGGGSFGISSVYSKHFFRVGVMGETSRSWVIGQVLTSGDHGTEMFKVPKRDPFAFKGTDFGRCRQIFTDQMKEDKIWANSYRHKICDEMRRKATPDQLRQIATIIGWQPKEDTR